MVKIRVLRLIEYEGPRDWVEEQVAHSIHGERRFGPDDENVIRAVTIGDRAEVLGNLPVTRGYPGCVADGQMTEHDRTRMDKALRCDRNDLGSVEDAVRGLQSTDHPSLCSLHDELMLRHQQLKEEEAENSKGQ